MFVINYTSFEGEVVYQKTYSSGSIFLEDCTQLQTLLDEVNTKYDDKAVVVTATIAGKMYATADIHQNFIIEPLAGFVRYFKDTK